MTEEEREVCALRSNIPSSLAQEFAQICSAVKYNALSNRQIKVFTDSQYALKAEQGLGQDSEQFFTESIARMSHEMLNSSNTNTNIQFQWSPAHSKIPGNEKAHKLAQTATEKGKKVLNRAFNVILLRALLLANEHGR